MRLEPPGSLRALLVRREGLRVEFKRHLPKEKRFVRLLASFANTGGGAILLGVDDDGSVRGLADPKGVATEVKALAALHVEPAPALDDGETLAKRLARLSAPVRGRLERAREHTDRLTRSAYARDANVSERTARRDLAELSRAYLIVEVEKGLFEILDE